MAQLLFLFWLSCAGISTEFPASENQIPDTIQSDSLTVYIFLHDECVISQFYTPLLSELHKKYGSKKIGFTGLFPNPSTNPDHISAFAKKFKLDFQLSEDYSKEVTKKFGITVTPEIAVWDHATERLIYRGRIDDSYVRVGKRKLHPQHHDLRNILDRWLEKDPFPEMVSTPAIGCWINLDLKP